MKARRLAVEIPARPAAPAPDLAPAIGLFHRFIQAGALPGLALDVADYRHVPGGPGVLLIAHEADYGISGRGLRVLRKAGGEGLALGETLGEALCMARAALRAIEKDGGFAMQFATADFSLELLDRLAFPNTAEGAAAAEAAALPALRGLFGAACEMARDENDPRAPLRFRVQGAPLEAAALPDAPALSTAAQAAPQPAPAAQTAQAQSPWDIEVEALQQMRAEGAPHLVVDVREPHEYEICNLDGELLPLGQLPDWSGDLPRDRTLVVHCRTGGRSARAVQALRAAGFERAFNLRGGILAWIDRVDASLRRY